MTDAPPLVVEDLDDAIAQTIKALGGFKRVGAQLRPDMEPRAAGRWLSDACNPREREVLKPSQLAWLRRHARAAGVHTLAAFELRDAGYAPPVPVEPQDEYAQLQRVFSESVRTQQSLVERMEALAARMHRNGPA
jgi:hypothetical protein